MAHAKIDYKPAPGWATGCFFADEYKSTCEPKWAEK
jgi:hypothetical protein